MEQQYLDFIDNLISKGIFTSYYAFVYDSINDDATFSAEYFGCSKLFRIFTTNEIINYENIPNPNISDEENEFTDFIWNLLKNNFFTYAYIETYSANNDSVFIGRDHTFQDKRYTIYKENNEILFNEYTEVIPDTGPEFIPDTEPDVPPDPEVTPDPEPEVTPDIEPEVIPGPILPTLNQRLLDYLGTLTLPTEIQFMSFNENNGILEFSGRDTDGNIKIFQLTEITKTDYYKIVKESDTITHTKTDDISYNYTTPDCELKTEFLNYLTTIQDDFVYLNLLHVNELNQDGIFEGRQIQFVYSEKPNSRYDVVQTESDFMINVRTYLSGLTTNKTFIRTQLMNLDEFHQTAKFSGIDKQGIEKFYLIINGMDGNLGYIENVSYQLQIENENKTNINDLSISMVENIPKVYNEISVERKMTSNIDLWKKLIEKNEIDVPDGIKNGIYLIDKDDSLLTEDEIVTKRIVTDHINKLKARYKIEAEVGDIHDLIADISKRVTLNERLLIRIAHEKFTGVPMAQEYTAGYTYLVTQYLAALDAGYFRDRADLEDPLEMFGILMGRVSQIAQIVDEEYFQKKQ